MDFYVFCQRPLLWSHSARSASLLPVSQIAKIKIREFFTGKSFSEVLIFASTKPQYDDRLFIELQVQYMKIPSSEHGENMSCTEIVFDIQNNFCTQHAGILSLQFSWTMNNLSSYCGFVNAKIRASDKDLPVCIYIWYVRTYEISRLDVIEFYQVDLQVIFNEID